MDDYLEYLAERKYELYHRLSVAVPQAYTENECTKRIENIHRLEEVLRVIAFLPSHCQQTVDARYEQMKNALS